MRIGRQIAETVELRLPPGLERTEMLRSAWARAQLPMDGACSAATRISSAAARTARVDCDGAGLDPSVLILDQPTTGLDAATQARLLNVIRALRSEQNSSIVYVSHDLGVVRNLATGWP